MKRWAVVLAGLVGFVAYTSGAAAWKGDGPIVGEEFEVGQDVYMAAAGEEQHPAVAFDGENYLVVWTDDRVLSEPYYAWDIYGARVRASDGALLDPVGFPIATAEGLQSSPAAAFDGVNYLVVWGDSRLPDTGADIFAARVVASSGEVLDPEGILVSSSERYETAPAVAFDGENYLAVWQVGLDGDNVGSGQIMGARVRASDGEVIDPDGILISEASGYRYDPQVACLDVACLAVWHDRRNPFSTTGPDLYGTRMDTASGAVLDPAGIPLVTTAEGSYSPSLATNGEDFLLAWHEYPDGMDSDIFATRIRGSDFEVLDSPALVVSDAVESQLYPQVTAHGADYVVVWQDGRTENVGYGVYGYDIYAARVAADTGAVGDPEGIPVYTSPDDDDEYQEAPSIAAGGESCLVVWEDSRLGSHETDIRGARMGTSTWEVVGAGGMMISQVRNSQFEPTVARGEDGKVLIAWRDSRNVGTTGWDIYAELFTVEGGGVMDAQELAVAVEEEIQMLPGVAFDGENFLVVWIDRRGDSAAYGARIRAEDGELLDPGGFKISSDGCYVRSVDVAAGEGGFLVVYEEKNLTGDDNTWNIFGVRVESSSGTVLDPEGIVISDIHDDQEEPCVVFGDKEFLVLWTDGREEIPSGYPDVYAARVDAQDGTVIDPDGIPVSVAVFGQSSPAAVFDGEGYRVAWADRGQGGDYDIHTVAMSEDCELLPPDEGQEVISASDDQFAPRVSSSQGRGFVVWADRRTYRSTQDDVWMARVDSSGQIDRFPIADTYWLETLPQIEFDDEGEAVVVYERHSADGIRVVGRVVEDDLWEEETDTDTGTSGGDAGMIVFDVPGAQKEGSCGCASIGAPVGWSRMGLLIESLLLR